MATFTKRKRKLVLGNLLLLALFMTTASAQSVFTPKTSCSDYEYEKFVVETLVGDARLYYMCLPAFTNEYALSLNDSTLVYVHAKEKIGNIWYSEKFRKHGAKAKRKTRRYKLSISEDDCAVLENLFADATQTANFFNESIGIDGVSYNLHCWDKTVKAWSPRKGSRTGRVVHALDSLCYAVEHSDRAVLKRQLDTCRTLTKEFRNLYPLSFFRPSQKGYMSEEQLKTLIFSGFQDSTKVMKEDKWWYYIETLCIEVQIADFMTKKVNRNALCDSLTAWNREMYINHVQDIWPRQMLIDVNDTTVARCEVYSSRPGNSRVLYLPVEQLKHDIIFNAATLSEGYYMLSPTGKWQPVSREDYPLWPDFRW
ncbi:MAG: hypothetical protein IK032_04400 [Bacteroidales bacterium]|nr:hypothetical protein [Bacteroidales bacterium]